MQGLTKGRGRNRYPIHETTPRAAFVFKNKKDTTHLVPALWTIKQALPTVRLDVMIAEHVKSILTVTPWIDSILGYPRFPVGPKWHEDFGRIAALRQARYDAVINLNGSDRTSILTRLTGAPLRLGRVPQRGASFLFQHCFTHTVEAPFREHATYLQNCLCLEKAGFPSIAPVFPITIPDEIESKIKNLLQGLDDFVHISPFTNADERELPATLLAEALNRFDFPYVLSCAANDREARKLSTLLLLLKRPPAKIFRGDLNAAELAALIARSALHLGGDSGALHIALMTGTPSLSWFRRHPGNIEWIPDGPIHRHLIGEGSPSGITGISLEELTSAIAETIRLLHPRKKSDDT
jgi:heptosyltransferase-3